MKKILSILIASITLITVTIRGNSVNEIQTFSATFLKNELTIMPDAATKDVKIIFKAAASGDAMITILDENGKKVLQQTTKIEKGNNNINIDNFHSLDEGNYTIQLINNNEAYSTKFLIWK